MRKDRGRRIRRYLNFILAAGLALGAVSSAVPEPMTVEATTIGQVQENIHQHEEEIKKWNEQAASLEDEQDLIEEQIADLNAEVINTMASIDFLEEEINQKTAEIEEKEKQIGETQAEYDAAMIREETQRKSMIECTRMLYENQDVSYLKALLEGKGLADVLNQMDYVEKVYEYSMNRLNEFIETKNQVHDLWNRLEEEKAGLDLDKAGLEDDKSTMEDLKADLNLKLEKKKKESANYEAEIKKARQEAAVAKKLLQQDKQKLKQLQDAQKAQQNAANITISNTSYTALIDGAAGSDLGKRIAKYACQFVGNPYVAGGTSLTNGADCSGFTYRIYHDFGYNIPRTSTQQRSAGTAVAYEDAQPGDLICYEGHVAMYIGGGMIVHASSAKTGIKVSRAQYRTILAVRRIV